MKIIMFAVLAVVMLLCLGCGDPCDDGICQPDALNMVCSIN